MTTLINRKQGVTFRTIFGPGCLRAPPMVADGSEAGHFSPLLLFLRLLIFTHFGETPVNEILFPPNPFFGITRRNKKKLGDYYFFTRKKN